MESTSEFLELLKFYLEESVEFLDEYERILLQMEQSEQENPDPALLGEILSLLHTFKGNSGMMGYDSLQKYIHRLEDLFKTLQAEKTALDSPFLEFALRSASRLREALSGITPDTPGGPFLEEEINLVECFLRERSESYLPSARAPAGAASDLERAFSQKTNLLKVDFERLDNLMNLMGELVICRTRLGQLDGQFREVYGEQGLTLDLASTAEQIEKITTELHEAIMQVRMIPIKHTFRRFPRVVRDLAREQGKEVSIQFEGEETELDKTVIDEIGEPLLHLVRNAVDHGIETPEEREAQGKPRRGTILLRAFQESSQVIITVEDDGRGIDEARLREKALQAGLLPDKAGRRELLELIFLPGLSTSAQITEISGRGLGMDVVKKSIAKINGNIEVESDPSSGTHFTIRLPLTMAIISALMVEVSGEQYALPLASVVESIRVEGGDIHYINNREVVLVRGYLLPLIRLSEVFSLPRTTNRKYTLVVIVRSTVGQMGMVVDSLLGQQEIVIKALEDRPDEVTDIAGATILGDGRVVLIVDIPAVMEKARLSGFNSGTSEVRYA